MQTEATATSQAKPADAAKLKSAMVRLIDGVALVGVAKVKDRGPRTYDGKTSEVLLLESLGFSQKFYSDSPEEHRGWPVKGDLVEFTCPLVKTADGGYRPSNPSEISILGTFYRTNWAGWQGSHTPTTRPLSPKDWG
jgi:hypothetical protein